MKKKVLIILASIFVLAILMSNICFAKDIDQINKYYINIYHNYNLNFK